MENNCETPAHQIIEALTESKENRDRLVRTFCNCAVIIAVGASLGLFYGVGLYVRDFINERTTKHAVDQ